MMDHPSQNSVFMRACRGEPVPFVPVWLMRQAGRYMKEYRELRSRVSFLELCRSPELVAETTVFAQERIGADAAIVFSDLLLILEAMGMDLSYPKGGPQLAPPLRDGAAVDALDEVQPEERLSYVWDGVRATREALQDPIPLIGFSGAPFTLAAYACEGGPSRSFIHSKTLMYRDSGAFCALMEKLVRGLIPYLSGQVEAGAQAVQVFDSWVGALGPADYRRYVLPHSKALIDGFTSLHPEVPLIHFGTGTAPLLTAMQEAGGTVIGIDFHTDFAWARKLLGDKQVVQGNLDPILLFAEPKLLLARAQELLDANAGKPGHILNLGHGILPGTPVDNVVRLIDHVHEASSR